LAGVDVARLIEALSRPEAYAHPVGAVEVHQTHISVVFLAGQFAYKIKKSVNLGFVDFSTLEKRKHFCDEEVRLNRRLAPRVYLGVVPVTTTPLTPSPSPPAGRGEDLRFGGDGPIVEWAVQMQRLPADATLEQRLLRGEVTPSHLADLAQRIADFHRHALANERIASFGRFDVVAENSRENFRQCELHVGATVSRAVFDRARELTETHLAKHHDLIECRASAGVPRDTHGDLHLDHVYLFPEATLPDDLVMIDCIEFSDRFRYADPVADMAFLAMDLEFHGRRDLAAVFADAYFAASVDAQGRALLPFYVAYRTIVRAKVEGMELAEREIGAEARWQAEQRARAHWLLALGELETPGSRPALVLMAGLPGSGKSTLARFLATSARFNVLRSDVVRKELAGDTGGPTAFGAGIYTDAWTERTYVELLRRAEAMLWQGQRVCIDANFRDDARRQVFLDSALRWGVPFLFIHCQAGDEATRARLQARTGDASDADWRIYQELARTWQPISADVIRLTRLLDTSGEIEENEQRLCAVLQQEGLLDA